MKPLPNHFTRPSAPPPSSLNKRERGLSFFSHLKQHLPTPPTNFPLPDLDLHHHSSTMVIREQSPQPKGGFQLMEPPQMEFQSDLKSSHMIGSTKTPAYQATLLPPYAAPPPLLYLYPTTLGGFIIHIQEFSFLKVGQLGDPPSFSWSVAMEKKKSFMQQVGIDLGASGQGCSEVGGISMWRFELLSELYPAKDRPPPRPPPPLSVASCLVLYFMILVYVIFMSYCLAGFFVRLYYVVGCFGSTFGYTHFHPRCEGYKTFGYTLLTPIILWWSDFGEGCLRLRSKFLWMFNVWHGLVFDYTFTSYSCVTPTRLEPSARTLAPDTSGDMIVQGQLANCQVKPITSNPIVPIVQHLKDCSLSQIVPSPTSETKGLKWDSTYPADEAVGEAVFRGSESVTVFGHLLGMLSYVYFYYVTNNIGCIFFASPSFFVRVGVCLME